MITDLKRRKFCKNQYTTTSVLKFFMVIEDNIPALLCVPGFSRAAINDIKSHAEIVLIRPSENIILVYSQIESVSNQTDPDKKCRISDQTALDSFCAIEVQSNPSMVILECSRQFLCTRKELRS